MLPRERFRLLQDPVDREAQLYLFDSITAVKYVVPEGKSRYEGVFYCESKDGVIEQLQNSWIWIHFDHNFLEAVIKASSSNEFIPFEEKMELFYDNRQIQQLHFVIMCRQPHFEGVCGDGTIVLLDFEHVRNSFPDHFIQQVVKAANQQVGKFYTVPPGAPNTFTGHHLVDPSLPKVEYRQHQNSTCLFLSLDSAIHYLGLTEVAFKIYLHSCKSSADAQEGIRNWEDLLELWHQCFLAFMHPNKLEPTSFDVLTDVSKFPTVLKLEADDGGIQHAVTIVGKLLFDSNCPYALPFSKESLDYCCSTDEKAGYFSKIFRGYRFMEPGAREKYDHYLLKHCVDLHT